MRFALVVVALLFLVPTASAQGTIKVRVTPQSESITVTAGERKDLPLSVVVEFVGTNCQHGSTAGVSLVLGTFPSWAGASIRPQSAKYAHPKETKAATLEILADEENAPDGGTITYQIEPLVSQPNATACPASPSVDAPKAKVTATVLNKAKTAPASSDGEGGGGGSPGLSALLVFVALGLGLAGRRRRG